MACDMTDMNDNDGQSYMMMAHDDGIDVLTVNAIFGVLSAKPF